jgi:chromate reductase, NAD(P)H dehydrogenase (quinone)
MIISGTNRPGANALRVSRVLERHYQALKVPCQVYSLADLPTELFAPTSYASKPEAFVAVQQRVLQSAGLHVVTPEYNGSFPGVLKYFIDMLKFPESFERKPVAFVGQANGAWGALRAVEQLQMIFGYRNAHIYPERVFIPGVKGKFDADGNLTDAEIDQRLARQARGFAMFISCIANVPSSH